MAYLNDEKDLKHQYWMNVIHECKSSNMKTRDWLKQNNISKDTYYYWFKKLKERTLDSINESSSGDLPVPTVSKQFVELPVPTAPAKTIDSDVCASISFNGVTIDITNKANPTFLASLFEVIGNVK